MVEHYSELYEEGVVERINGVWSSFLINRVSLQIYGKFAPPKGGALVVYISPSTCSHIGLFSMTEGMT